ncbi:argH [Symbiodinium microadriaticum]|nr:argH [Symbiodinium microadriaticum]
MEAINASIHFDKRLYAQDIAGSIAHAEMLGAQGILSSEDVASIKDGLNTILREIEDGDFEFSAALEDIHMNVENRLRDLIGDAAGRLHTGRSRNDQVATDFRLWVRDATDEISAELKALATALVDKADAHSDTVMPGFTHLQAAQPVTFGHYCLAFFEMFTRDLGRFNDARARLNESPLGAAALAGTPYDIDRDATASALGFDHPMRNSLDAVSARDFALEFLSACAITATHISRLAEDIVVWSSAQFQFVKLPDGLTTGSSIMPQKRNPDAAELARAKSGRIIGDLASLLIVMKGLPLAYSKDMQEDKEPVFDATESLLLCLRAMTGMIEGLTPNKEAMADAAGQGFTTATDLADWLVMKLDMPFRDAHHVTGSLVKLAEDKGCDLQDLTLADMQSVHDAITDDVFTVLGVDNSVKNRTSFGGTAPKNVKAAAKAAKKMLKDL